MPIFRLWPSTNGPASDANDSTAYTLGVEFHLSQPCTFTALYFWRAVLGDAIPSQGVIFKVSGQSQVPGTSVTFTDPGTTGWIKATSNAGTVLAAHTPYIACVQVPSGTHSYSQTTHYWDTTGPGANGLQNGPLIAPNSTTASGPGQDTFHTGSSLTFPTGMFNASNYWIDIEVRATAPNAFMTFFS